MNITHAGEIRDVLLITYEPNCLLFINKPDEQKHDGTE